MFNLEKRYRNKIIIIIIVIYLCVCVGEKMRERENVVTWICCNVSVTACYQFMAARNQL